VASKFGQYKVNFITLQLDGFFVYPVLTDAYANIYLHYNFLGIDKHFLFRRVSNPAAAAAYKQIPCIAHKKWASSMGVKNCEAGNMRL